MLNWYVVKTKRLKEELAERNLINQHFVVYYPVIKTLKKIGNKFILVKKPLFPNYIFVQFDLNASNWSKINNTLGVSSLLSLSNNLSPVNNSDINDLKSAEDENNFIIISKIQNPTIGRLCKILEGPFKGKQAKFKEKKDNKNVFLIINLLGRDINLNLPYNCIEPV